MKPDYRPVTFPPIDVPALRAWQDLRFALRRMEKSKAFTLIAILSLALGIGANTSVFSLVNTILLRPLPVKNPERLVSLQYGYGKGQGYSMVFSYLNYRDLRDRNQALDGLIAYRMAAVSLSQRGNNDRAWGYLEAVINFKRVPPPRSLTST